MKVNPWAAAAVAIVALTLAGIGAKSLTRKPAIPITTPALTATPDALVVQFEDASARWDCGPSPTTAVVSSPATSARA